MYCIKCGVKLADSENSCPLCGTKVYHPDLKKEEGDPLYPRDKYPRESKRSKWPLIVLSAAFIIPIFVVILCDLQINGKVTWSGYAVGAILLGYIFFLLPKWFRDPNPVIFVPCTFAAIGGYVLYISIATGGGWFLSFAFPVIGIVGVISSVVATLLRYLKKGKLFVFGGASIALGVCMFPLEILTNVTFGIPRFSGWSFYPMLPLVLFGGFLIFLGAYKPARDTMARLFFI